MAANRRDEAGLRSETVRRANLSAIAQELHIAGPLSRSELGLRTGLTRSTIRALTGEFAAAGLVTEADTVPRGTPGRPSSLVAPYSSSVVAVGLEIAVDSLAAAVVGFGGEVVERVRVDRPRGAASVDDTVFALARLAGSIGAHPAQHRAIAGIGVAVVGVVRRSDGFVSMAPNLGWRDEPLGERLGVALGSAVPIVVANEADLGALAEVRRGAARGHRHVVFISGEVGVGGGLIVEGRPLIGVAGYGGEIGHLPVNPLGKRCQCGSIGCWETEVGEDALLVRAGRPAAGGREAVQSVLRDADAGEPAALVALNEVGLWLGRGIGAIVNVLNPELFVVGGLLGRVLPRVRRVVDAELARVALAASLSVVRVVPAELHEDAPVLGAAELAFESFLNDPADWLPSRAADTSRAVPAEMAGA
ncbi:MAG: ROK family protein [Chloroflexota bacterium]|nr:ROK family protein [Chloroflexota bacterium]